MFGGSWCWMACCIPIALSRMSRWVAVLSCIRLVCCLGIAVNVCFLARGLYWSIYDTYPAAWCSGLTSTTCIPEPIDRVISSLVGVFIDSITYVCDKWSSWVKRDQLDVTCFIISLFNAQRVSDVNTSILRSLRLICWVISWVVLINIRNMLSIK